MSTATFIVKVVHKKYRPCVSPRKYVFTVRRIDAYAEDIVCLIYSVRCA